MSVSDFVQRCKQPTGGYIGTDKFKAIEYKGRFIDSTDENVAPRYMGTVVELMARFIRTNDKKSSFKQILKTIQMLKDDGRYKEVKEGYKLLDNINGIDCDSMRNAIELVQRYHTVKTCMNPGPNELIIPSLDSVVNAIEMSCRCVRFANRVGIEKYGYPLYSTSILGYGECDMISQSDICDIKVSNFCGVNEKYSLQLLLYYVMSLNDMQVDIRCLSIFNPRYNMVWYLKIGDISVLEFVSTLKGCGLIK